MRLEAVDYRVGDFTLHGVAAGSGPLALMYHGITGNGYVFTPLIERLAQHFRCISFDQRGHGRSSKPATGYNAASFAADIAGVISTVGLGKALLIGHSLGARNSLVAAVAHPELTAGVVAIDFVPFIETAVFDALDARVTGGAQVFADLDAAKAYLANRYPKLPARAGRVPLLAGRAFHAGDLDRLAGRSCANSSRDTNAYAIDSWCGVQIGLKGSVGKNVHTAARSAGRRDS